MKRAVLVFLSLWTVVFWTGCATSGKAMLLAQRDPIALVSVVSNHNVNWKGEAPIDPNKEPGIISRWAMREEEADQVVASATNELIKTAETLFRQIMGETGPINLAERETVLGSRAYQEARINKNHVYEGLVKPDDFRFVDYRDKNFPAALAKETGIQRTMYVEFNFVRAMTFGIGKHGTYRGEVEMTIYIYDAQGKRFFRKTVTMYSRPTLAVSLGIYSHTELMSHLQSTISDACYEFLDDFES